LILITDEVMEQVGDDLLKWIYELRSLVTILKRRIISQMPDMVCSKPGQSANNASDISHSLDKLMSDYDQYPAIYRNLHNVQPEQEKKINILMDTSNMTSHQLIEQEIKDRGFNWEMNEVMELAQFLSEKDLFAMIQLYYNQQEQWIKIVQSITENSDLNVAIKRIDDDLLKCIYKFRLLITVWKRKLILESSDIKLSTSTSTNGVNQKDLKMSTLLRDLMDLMIKFIVTQYLIMSIKLKGLPT